MRRSSVNVENQPRRPSGPSPYFVDETIIRSQTCGLCNNPVGGGAGAVRALARLWHPQCFRCFNCSKQMKSFVEFDGRAFCKKCYLQLHGARCLVCQDPIEGKVLRAMGYSFHHQCFRCVACKVGLSGKQFFEHNNEPWCTACQSHMHD